MPGVILDCPLGVGANNLGNLICVWGPRLNLTYNVVYRMGDYSMGLSCIVSLSVPQRVDDWCMACLACPFLFVLEPYFS